jgi:hypothetical protein
VTEDSVFWWTREAPASWHAEVERLAPKQDRASHLLLWWEPGAPEAPAQRFVIYQAMPFQYVPEAVMDAFLELRPCRCLTRGAFGELCPKCGGIESYARRRIETYLYDTGCFARPYWVIQGTNGGHRRLYSQVDQQVARLTGQPPEPPDTGALCYAPMDQRVVGRIRRHDLAQRAFFALQDAAAHEQRNAQVEFHTALADYMDVSVAAAFDAVPLRTKGSLVDELPQDHTQDRRVIDYEAERERFITQE